MLAGEECLLPGRAVCTLYGARGLSLEGWECVKEADNLGEQLKPSTGE